MSTITERWSIRGREVTKFATDVFASAGYECGDCLGIGGTSEVFKVRSVRNARVYAAKRPICRKDGSSEPVDCIKREMRALRALSHPHILGVVDEYHEPHNSQCLLITELCEAGTLQELIDHTGKPLPTEQTVQCTLQIADALQYMHCKGMYHSDIKPRNIFLHSVYPSIDLALGDFADVKKINTFSIVCGTRAYYSPQMIETGVHCGPSDDMWALGITVMGMLQQWPKLKYMHEELKEYPATCHGHARRLLALNRGNWIARLLVKLLEWNEAKRCDAEECRALAMRMGEILKDGEEWMIKSPQGFQPTSFW